MVFDPSAQVIDFELSPELRAFREKVRNYCAEHLTAAAEWDEKAQYPREAIAAAAEQGLLRTPVSREYGGSAIGNLANCVMLEEINSVCPSTGVTISVHNSLVNSLIDKWATDEQKRRYFPKLVAGEWLGAYCLSEAFSGSDAAALRCKARREGDKYVLNGAKLWITTGSEASLFLVFARTGGTRGEDGSRAFEEAGVESRVRSRECRQPFCVRFQFVEGDGRRALHARAVFATRPFAPLPAREQTRKMTPTRG